MKLKKVLSVAAALCLVFTSASAFAKTDHDGKKHHVHTKAYHKAHGKLHTKAKAGHKLHTKATTPKMPKTGMGGASN